MNMGVLVHNKSDLPVRAAYAKHIAVKSSIQKVNLVAGLIKGLKASEAMLQLQFSKKKVAYDLRKILQAAIANAENNFNFDIDKLYVKAILVGKSFALKRLHARARGRSARVQKPFSRVTIIVNEKE